jgi:hypothetical protein
MSRKKKEPTDWDALLKQQKTYYEFTPEDFARPGVCMLPPDHHEIMKGWRPRAEKDAKEG